MGIFLMLIDLDSQKLNLSICLLLVSTTWSIWKRNLKVVKALTAKSINFNKNNKIKKIKSIGIVYASSFQICCEIPLKSLIAFNKKIISTQKKKKKKKKKKS